MHPPIRTHRLTKSYKGFHAVKDVSFSINKGDIYGFIGLNGAGKTTTIKMLLGMIRPTHGTCYINGKKVTHKNQNIWKNVGYIVDAPAAYPELTVEENLEICRRLRLISDPQAVSQTMAQLHLTPYAHKKAKDLSLGNAGRLGIAKAILHRPDILILDEPMNGLDPSGIAGIRTFLRDLALNQGVTILISSHLLSEVAKMATKIGIIHEGELIQELAASQLHRHLNRRLIIDCPDNPSAADRLSSAGYPALLNRHGLVETSDVSAIQHPEEISRFLVNEGFPPMQLTVEGEDLESYFLRVIREKGETSE